MHTLDVRPGQRHNPAHSRPRILNKADQGYVHHTPPADARSALPSDCPSLNLARSPSSYSEIAVQVQRHRSATTGNIVPHGPGHTALEGCVETRVLVVSGYRGRRDPQGRRPCTRLRPVFEVGSHIFGGSRERTSPRSLRPRDEAAPLVDVAIPRPRSS